jgi:hemerythrin-like domain-containing protein
MRRHDTLIPLTHDHHHALARARRLGAAAAAAPAARKAVALDFIDFYRKDTLLHFREEEELIFPLVVDCEEAEAALSRLMMEHLRIHALVRTLVTEVGEDDLRPETMDGLATLLEGHIRFEEKTFFPLVEKLAAPALVAVELAHRERKSGPSSEALDDS